MDSIKFKECLNIAAKENQWDDWNDVLYNSSYRRTIEQIMEEAIEIYNEDV